MCAHCQISVDADHPNAKKTADVGPKNHPNARKRPTIHTTTLVTARLRNNRFFIL